MSNSKKRRPGTPATKLVEIGLAVPQVMAHRLTRMALAGPVLSARDQKEFTTMVVEKQIAFAQSWWAMSIELASQQQRFFWAWLGVFAPRGKRMASPLDSWQRVMDAGLTPVHRRAVVNSKRLARTKLR